MNPIVHRSIATLKLPKQVALLIGIAKAIALAVSGNKAFPTPDPTIATLDTAIADLETAETAVKTRAPGAVAARNQKRAALVALLEQLKGYVQKIADADPAHATELVQSAAMNVKKVSIRAKRVFDARPGAVSGSVTLVTVSAGNRASYEWEYSSDGGKSWQAALPTLQARMSLTGLQPGAGYSFRYRAVTKAGAGDWSQPVSLLVR
jgi:fibronectin type III domain protein